MRPQKISQAQLLQHCAQTFKRYGYAGTSMQMLADACGLSKGAFYYYYSNKEALLNDILADVYQFFTAQILPIATNAALDVLERFALMHKYTLPYFSQGNIGCLMAIISLEADERLLETRQIIQSFFQCWQQAMYYLFVEKYIEERARILAKQSIADYEGAILMYRFSQDSFYIEQVKLRVEALLK